MSDTLDTDRPIPQSVAENAATALPEALAGPSVSDLGEGEGGTLLALNDFITEFGSGLLAQVRAQNPPIDDGVYPPARDAVINQLLRKPFEAQRRAVQAICKLLLDHNAPAGIINAEMGTGKTMMSPPKPPPHQRIDAVPDQRSQSSPTTRRPARGDRPSGWSACCACTSCSSGTAWLTKP